MKFLTVWLLLALTVMIHAAGLAILLRCLMKSKAWTDLRRWSAVRLLVSAAWWIILLHLGSIMLWALFYWWQGCLPDLNTSFYFSGVTYTTLGYGDVILPRNWRLFAPVEGLVGILMCGLSTGFFFAIVNKLAAGKTSPQIGDRD